MDCVAIIPARHHSVRLPGKLLASLAGRPMIQHVVECCLRVDGVRRVVVATDHVEIAAAAQAAGADTCLTPSDLPSGTDRVAAAAQDYPSEIILNVQGDEPLLDPGELGRALSAFHSDGCDFGTLRSPLRESRDLWDANVVKVVTDCEGRALYFTRGPAPFPKAEWIGAGAGRPEAGAIGVGGRIVFANAPELPGPYAVHVGVYFYRRAGLVRWARLEPSTLERVEGLEQLRLLEAGEVIRTYEVVASHPGVNTKEDLERVRAVLEGGQADGRE